MSLSLLARFARCVNTHNISRIVKGKTERKNGYFHNFAHSTDLSNDVTVPTSLLKGSFKKSEMPVLLKAQPLLWDTQSLYLCFYKENILQH